MAKISFDRETQDQYQLYIRASNDPDYYASKDERTHRDIMERDSSVARVRVVILDANDNAPRFDRTEYFAGAESNSENERRRRINKSSRPFEVDCFPRKNCTLF